MSGDITPCVWFDGRVREAAHFYVDLFPGSVIERDDDFMSIIVINGQRLQLLNGGPHFPQTCAFSLVVPCVDQAELDHYWEALIADGGAEQQCGWCSDRFGVNWQVIPADIESYVSAGQPVMDALMGMVRIDIAALAAARESARAADV